MPAPVARKKPVALERHGVRWIDDYAWLRDPGYPKVEDKEILAYLEAENAWFQEVMRPHGALIESLYEELKSRIVDDDASVPVPHGPYLYGWRFAAGAQYRSWYRMPRHGGDETMLLDEPALAAGKDYFNLGGLAVSADHTRLAFSTDTDGSERYVIHVCESGGAKEPTEVARNSSGRIVWSADGSTLFYVELNDNLRPFRVRAHNLGDGEDEDRIVFEEADPAYFVSLGRSSDRRWIIINSGTHVTHEAHLIDAHDPAAAPLLVSARREGHRYEVDHAHGRFWILTNDAHENSRLVSAPDGEVSESAWREEIAGSDRHYLLGVSCFADFMVVSGRTDGLSSIRIRSYDGADEHTIDFGEAVYSAGLGDNREFETDRIRLHFSSLTTPATVFDYVVAGRELITRKVQKIPSGYDPELYTSRRIWAEAGDGASVPISVVHRKDFVTDGTGPLYLYGYGAYGMGMDPAFSTGRISLLDRGFAFAIAHIRGGDEMGWNWYEAGKLEHKTNSFTDFIACAERLIEEGYAQPGRIAIGGGSAGGMLMGAVANMRPDLWGCVTAQVPFVDVLATMLDDSLPLTPIEWPEWGDPIRDRAAFERIRAYSPYDNVRRQAYPPMIVTAGIADPRVTYWEPAKWVAKLRATKTGDDLLVMKTNMGAGHFGASGRYEALRELAEIYAFVLGCLGVENGE